MTCIGQYGTILYYIYYMELYSNILGDMRHIWKTHQCGDKFGDVGIATGFKLEYDFIQLQIYPS